MIDQATTAPWYETQSGIYIPSKPKRKHPIGIDLFCGAGGFSLGMMSAGFEVVAAADWAPECMITYLANLGAYPVNLVFVDESDRDRATESIEAEFRRGGWWGKGKAGAFMGEGTWSDLHHLGPPVSGAYRAQQHVLPDDLPGVSNFFMGDIGKLTGERILQECGLERGEVDIVFGGPPCQGFSSAGKQNVMDPRNSYVFEFIRLVLEIQPKTMCFENVPELLNMTTPEGIPVVDAMCRALADGGFGAVDALKKSLLATSGAGAAMKGSQNRKSVSAASRNKQQQGPDDQQLGLFGKGAA